MVCLPYLLLSVQPDCFRSDGLSTEVRCNQARIDNFQKAKFSCFKPELWYRYHIIFSRIVQIVELPYPVPTIKCLGISRQ